MKQSSLEQYLFWARPIITILLGVTLLLHPLSVTKTAALCIGLALAVVGAALMIAYFFGSHSGLTRLLAGIVCFLIGISIVRNPMALPIRLGRLIGIILIIDWIREIASPFPTRSRVMAWILGACGLLLLVLPGAASWLICTITGVVVLGSGCGMLGQRLYGRKHPPKARIVDSE